MHIISAMIWKHHAQTMHKQSYADEKLGVQVIMAHRAEGLLHSTV